MNGFRNRFFYGIFRQVEGSEVLIPFAISKETQNNKK